MDEIKNEKVLSDQEAEYLDYILTVIRNKAQDIETFINPMLYPSKMSLDPEKLKMDIGPLREALNTAIDELYSRYPERRVSYRRYYSPCSHYLNYAKTV